MNIISPLRIASITCDDNFDAGGMITVIIHMSLSRARNYSLTPVFSNAPRARSEAFWASESPRMPVISSRS
jgi:hypothetical protein